MSGPSLRTTIGALSLRNPILLASGTCGYGEELASIVDLSQLGGIVVKTITTRPREGNPPPRTAETPSGMLNAIGLQNVGIDRFVAEKWPLLRELDLSVIANIAGESVDDFARLADRIVECEGIAGLELNISCPNIAHGMDFAVDPHAAEELVRTVRRHCKLPLIVKLSPNVTRPDEIARAAEAAGADAVSLINTILGMSVDPHTGRPRLANVTGGLSGPAIRPVAVRMVWQVARAVAIPVIGIGGIRTVEDVVEFLLVGATAVQIGTATFVDPMLCERLPRELSEWLARDGVTDVSQLVGAVQLPDR